MSEGAAPMYERSEGSPTEAGLNDVFQAWYGDGLPPRTAVVPEPPGYAEEPETGSQQAGALSQEQYDATGYLEGQQRLLDIAQADSEAYQQTLQALQSQYGLNEQPGEPYMTEAEQYAEDEWQPEDTPSDLNALLRSASPEEIEAMQESWQANEQVQNALAAEQAEAEAGEWAQAYAREYQIPPEHVDALPGLANQFLEEAIAERYRQGASVEQVQAEMAQDRDNIVSLAFHRAGEAAQQAVVRETLLDGFGRGEPTIARAMDAQAANARRIAEQSVSQKAAFDSILGGY
jgi:hypothetical protein